MPGIQVLLLDVSEILALIHDFMALAVVTEVV